MKFNKFKLILTINPLSTKENFRSLHFLTKRNFDWVKKSNRFVKLKNTSISRVPKIKFKIVDNF